MLVSDNATNFTSEEFGIFMKKNGIRHVRTPPYLPASNGLAERAIQTLKDSLRKIKTGKHVYPGSHSSIVTLLILLLG